MAEEIKQEMEILRKEPEFQKFLAECRKKFSYEELAAALLGAHNKQELLEKQLDSAACSYAELLLLVKTATKYH